MTRALSTSGKSFIHARAPGDACLQLIRIAHADLSVTMRFVSEGEDVESGGDSYLKRWFMLPLPSDTDGQVETTLDLDVTDLNDEDLLVLASAGDDHPTVESDLVLASDLETVEASFYFQMRNVTVDLGRLRASLRYEPFLAKPWPGHVYDAASFPDIYQ